MSKANPTVTMPIAHYNQLKNRIAELEQGYEELRIEALNAVQCMSGGLCKANLRDAYDKATEQLTDKPK